MKGDIIKKAYQNCLFGTVELLARVAQLYQPSSEVYPTGIYAFDNAMDGGVREGELITISGSSGEGKTSFAVNLSLNFNNKGIPSLWFSYEMNPWYLRKKFDKIILPKSLYDVSVYAPIELIDSELKFIDQQIKEGIKEKAVKIVVIDHLHYLIDLKSSLNSSLLIGAIVRELKQIAIDNKVIIFLIAHTRKLNTGDELNLSSVRDSGMIICESDYVFLIERRKQKKAAGERDKKIEENKRAEEGYFSSGSNFLDESRITLAKNRRTGKILYKDFKVENEKFIEITNNIKDYEQYI
uniref:Putative helicase n=1 Tax=viral metagenome TaxID=1070528 RepID=A0A6M3LDE4_9ZZZZ